MTSVQSIIPAAIGLLVLSFPAYPQTGKAAPAPEAVVRELVDAMAANDAARIRSAFAATASQAYGTGDWKTGEQFSKWLQSDIIDRRGRVIGPRLITTGDEVVVTGEFRNNTGYTSAANFLFKVGDGKIVSWRMRY